jgi:hypothetical protein
MPSWAFAGAAGANVTRTRIASNRMRRFID